MEFCVGAHFIAIFQTHLKRKRVAKELSDILEVYAKGSRQ